MIIHTPWHRTYFYNTTVLTFLPGLTGAYSDGNQVTTGKNVKDTQVVCSFWTEAEGHSPHSSEDHTQANRDQEQRWAVAATTLQQGEPIEGFLTTWGFYAGVTSTSTKQEHLQETKRPMIYEIYSKLSMVVAYS